MNNIMTYEQLVKKISPTLKRITYRLKGRFCAFDHDDLFQEALIRLWEDFGLGKLADKTDSYILQGCYFHLKNYIRKHYPKASLLSLESAVNEDGQSGDDTDRRFRIKHEDSLLDTVHCKMLLETIQNNGLTKREKEVFSLGLEGLTTREIGGRLGISHVRVVKLRKTMREKCKKHLDGF